MDEIMASLHHYNFDKCYWNSDGSISVIHQVGNFRLEMIIPNNVAYDNYLHNYVSKFVNAIGIL